MAMAMMVHIWVGEINEQLIFFSDTTIARSILYRSKVSGKKLGAIVLKNSCNFQFLFFSHQTLVLCWLGNWLVKKNLRQSNNQKRKRHSNSEEIPKIPPKGIFSLSIFQKKTVKNHAQKTFSFSETQRIQIIRFGPSKDCSRSACPESPW